MKYLLFLCFVFSVFLPLGEASPFLRQELKNCLKTGQTGNIESFCLSRVRNAIDCGKINERTLKEKILPNLELRQMTHIAFLFSSLRKQKVPVVQDLKDEQFVDWLLDNPCVFEKISFSGKSHRMTFNVLKRIRELENGNLAGRKLEAALGASIASSKDPDKAIALYSFFEDSHQKKKLFSQYDKLLFWEYAILFGANESLEELAWGQNYIDEKNVTEARVGRIYGFIPYRAKNKNGVSIHQGGAFYDFKPVTLPIYVEYGGVCGAVSKGTCGFFRSKGIPSYTIGQPGHCAFVWRTASKGWTIGNDIYGWVWSTGGNSLWGSPVSSVVALFRFCHDPGFSNSQYCFYLSDIVRDNSNKLFLLENSILENDQNYPAWKNLFKLLRENISLEDKKKWIRKVQNAFVDNPCLLDCILPELIDLKKDKIKVWEYCSMFIPGKESNVAKEIFMKRFVRSFSDEVLGKRKVNYNTKNRRDIFNILYKESVDKEPVSKIKKKTLNVLGDVLENISVYDDLAISVLELYGKLIQKWGKDKFDENLKSIMAIRDSNCISEKVKKKINIIIEQ